jgi:hypothetical protein
MNEVLAALDRAIKLQPIFENDDRAFAAKYAEASVPALKEALKLVKARVDVEQASIIQDRMDAGLYEETFVPRGEPKPGLVGKGGGMSTFGVKNIRAEDGSTIVRTTEITAEEYPEFNAARMEMWWLIRNLHGR